MANFQECSDLVIRIVSLFELVYIVRVTIINSLEFLDLTIKVKQDRSQF